MPQKKVFHSHEVQSVVRQRLADGKDVDPEGVLDDLYRAYGRRDRTPRPETLAELIREAVATYEQLRRAERLSVLTEEIETRLAEAHHASLESQRDVVAEELLKVRETEKRIRARIAADLEDIRSEVRIARNMHRESQDKVDALEEKLSLKTKEAEALRDSIRTITEAKVEVERKLQDERMAFEGFQRAVQVLGIDLPSADKSLAADPVKTAEENGDQSSITPPPRPNGASPSKGKPTSASA